MGNDMKELYWPVKLLKCNILVKWFKTSLVRKSKKIVRGELKKPLKTAIISEFCHGVTQNYIPGIKLIPKKYCCLLSTDLNLLKCNSFHNEILKTHFFTAIAAANSNY